MPQLHDSNFTAYRARTHEEDRRGRNTMRTIFIVFGICFTYYTNVWFVYGHVCDLSTDPRTECAEEFYGENGPQNVSGSTLICRKNSTGDAFFLTAYGNDIRSPDWSAYYISTADAASLNSGRPFSWRLDDHVPDEEQATWRSRTTSHPEGNPCWGTNVNQRGFSYDRGHLAPNHIMSYAPNSCDAQYQTFYITNAAMQRDDFNQGPWETLETHVYGWLNDKAASVQAEGIFVITGTVYENRKLENGGSDLRCSMATGDVYTRGDASDDGMDFVGVPTHYFKVMCDHVNGEVIAYLGTNEENSVMKGMSVNALEQDYLHYDLGLANCGNTYNYSIVHWDHGSWQTTSDSYIYVPGSARPSDDASSSLESTLFIAAGVGAGLVGLCVLIVCVCAVRKCRSSRRAPHKSARNEKRKSDYVGVGGHNNRGGWGGGDIEDNRGPAFSL